MLQASGNLIDPANLLSTWLAALCITPNYKDYVTFGVTALEDVVAAANVKYDISASGGVLGNEIALASSIVSTISSLVQAGAAAGITLPEEGLVRVVAGVYLVACEVDFSIGFALTVLSESLNLTPNAILSTGGPLNLIV